MKLHFYLAVLLIYFPVLPSFKNHLILNKNLMKLHEKSVFFFICMLILLLYKLFSFPLFLALHVIFITY